MNDPADSPCPHGDYRSCIVDGCRPLRGAHAQTCPCDPADRVHVVTDPEDFSQPCPHGDYRSCIVDGCRPFRRVHVAGVIVPPAPQVACMWCGGDSERGQCGPCAALLEAIHAAPLAGVVAIMDATRAVWAQPSLEGAAKPSSTELPSSEEQPSIEGLPTVDRAVSYNKLQSNAVASSGDAINAREGR